MIIDNIPNHIEALIGCLKKTPMNLNARLELIQYYCLNADWQKALSTTDGFLKIKHDPHVKSLLRQNILCEAQREKIFRGHETASPYPNTTLNNNQSSLLQAFYGNHNDMINLFNQVINDHNFNMCITTYDGQTYQDLWIDSDFRLASILEVFIEDQYYWLSMKNIQSIHFWKHEVLTDVLWRRAKITLQNQQEFSAFIPARYPILTEVSEDIKQNKLTQWEQISGLSWANGQKTLTSGDTDVSLLDIDIMIRV